MQGMGKITASLLLTVASLAAGTVGASAPLDFNYRVAGEEHVRPVLVFNDGEDIFIQPNPVTASEVRVVGVSAERQGPYLVVRGLANTFTLAVKKYGIAEISYKGTPAAKVAVEKPQVANAASMKVAAAGQGEGKISVAQAPSQKAAPSAEPPSVSESLAKKQKECKPQRDDKESAFVVTFPEGQSVLTATVREALAQVATKPEEISVLEITGASDSSKKNIAASRAEAIKAYLVDKGVSERTISIAGRSATGIGSELRIVRSSIYPCSVNGFAVSYKNSLTMTAMGNGDAVELLKRVADEAGIGFQTEGTVRRIEISVSMVGKSLMSVLETVGEKLGADADVVYRGQQLVLRFR